VRCRAIRQVKHDFVNVTPAPAFGRIIGFDDRVAGCMKMLRRVAVGRLITATDMTASAADAQMQPRIAQLQAFFAPEGTGNNVANYRQMSAALYHFPTQCPSIVCWLIPWSEFLPVAGQAALVLASRNLRGPRQRLRLNDPVSNLRSASGQSRRPKLLVALRLQPAAARCRACAPLNSLIIAWLNAGISSGFRLVTKP
jgi:hypothetical protein